MQLFFFNITQLSLSFGFVFQQIYTLCKDIEITHIWEKCNDIWFFLYPTLLDSITEKKGLATEIYAVSGFYHALDRRQKRQ